MVFFLERIEFDIKYMRESDDETDVLPDTRMQVAERECKYPIQKIRVYRGFEGSPLSLHSTFFLHSMRVM